MLKAEAFDWYKCLLHPGVESRRREWGGGPRPEASGFYEERGTVQLQIKSKEDFLSGLMFIGFGLAAIIASREYPMGTAMRMGPGYFPTYVGGLLILFGLILAAQAFVSKGEGVAGFAWRPVLVLSAAFLVFGFAMDHVGFIPSLVVLIVGSALAGKEFRIIEVVILTVVMTVASVGIFIYGIELPFRLFWWS
jgi:Tripartite tricarboxylate transporter TctB family.